MAQYVISIGGSGSRCAEALCYLCAAGLGPKGIRFVFVDPDVANGNVHRALTNIRRYRAVQVELAELNRADSEDSRIFANTRVELSDPEVWSPFESTARTPKLAEFFEANTLRTRSPAARLLFDCLYSPAQQSAALDIGFRGRPSMGAAVFGAKLDVDVAEPWRSIAKQIENEAGSGEFAKIFVFGSSFGGTGASGVPTIPRLLKRTLNAGKDHASFGGALLLPYFSFISDRTLQNNELYADPSKYLLNSQAALKYYADNNLEYESLYVLGTQQLGTRGTFSLGGQSQCDGAHAVELLAALAAIDFFKGPSDKRQTAFLGRRSIDALVWPDIPDSGATQAALGQLTRTFIAYLSIFWPVLFKAAQGDPRARRVPWFVDFFERQKIDLSRREDLEPLEAMQAISSGYLTWFREIHHVGSDLSDDLKVELADTEALLDPARPSEMREDLFASVVNEGTSASKSTNSVWRRMCDYNGGSRNRVGGGPSVSALRRFYRSLFTATA